MNNINTKTDLCEEHTKIFKKTLRGKHKNLVYVKGIISNKKGKDKMMNSCKIII